MKSSMSSNKQLLLDEFPNYLTTLLQYVSNGMYISHCGFTAIVT